MSIQFNQVSYIYQQGTPYEFEAIKDISLTLEQGKYYAIIGQTGSGKSTLIHDILHATLARELNGAKTTPGLYDRIEGMEHLDKVIEIDQSPIGRTPRSNPASTPRTPSCPGRPRSTCPRPRRRSRTPAAARAAPVAPSPWPTP